MRLVCNYEEITVLIQGGQALLGEEVEALFSSTAPSSAEVREVVGSFLPLLSQDLDFDTLAEQESAENAVVCIVGHLREVMENRVRATHPADEEAVAAYFDFAHALSVQARLQEMGDEMRALEEILAGSPLDSDRFPALPVTD
jgi:hypothetical protein